MKKLLVLLFSLMIQFNSYGEWIKVTENITLENIYYVDIDTIKESGGYVYWYQMNNYTKPNKWGDMSSIFYVQGDCGVNRSRLLSGIFYQQPIGISESSRETRKNPRMGLYFSWTG